MLCSRQGSLFVPVSPKTVLALKAELVYLFSYRTQFFVVSEEALLRFSRDNSWFLNVQRQYTKLVDYEPINCVVILAHYAHEPIRWRLILVITKGKTSKTRNLK